MVPCQTLTMSDALGILGVDNMMLTVGDMAAAKRFYGEVLGLEVKFDYSELGIMAYRLGAEEPGLILRIGDVSESPPRETPRVWLEVGDVHEAAKWLNAMKIPLVAPLGTMRTGWFLEFADPWGNVIGLADYLKAPDKARKAPDGAPPAGQ